MASADQHILSEDILLVDDDPATLECLVETVQLMGLPVFTASDGDTAMTLFDRERPSVVVTDIRMPKLDGLALTAHIKARQPECPVVVVTGYGDEATAIAALKAGASDYLPKPFQLNELKEIINRSLSLVRARNIENSSILAIERMDECLVIRNEPEKIGGIINYIIRTIECRLSETERLHLRVALQELLINAIEHGNLGISTEEKSKAILSDEYEQLVETRKKDSLCVSRRVKIWTVHNPQEGVFQCRIADEGKGFNWQQVVSTCAANMPMNLGSGRGIFLVKTLMPDLEYHGKGNDVTLTFRHSPP